MSAIDWHRVHMAIWREHDKADRQMRVNAEYEDSVNPPSEYYRHNAERCRERMEDDR